MTDLKLVRVYKVSPAKLFRFVSGAAELVTWFGPEGMKAVENDLDFSREGPWFAVLRGDSGHVAKVSGHVTHVDRPNSVGFTWAWHADQDQRGAESHVTFSVTAVAGGAQLVINHRDLKDDEAAAGHERGWSSSLVKLGALFS